MAERKRKLIDLDDDAAAKREKATTIAASAPVMADTSGGVNPYTGKAYSSKYYEILSKRTGRPRAGGVRCCGRAGLAGGGSVRSTAAALHLQQERQHTTRVVCAQRAFACS